MSILTKNQLNVKKSSKCGRYGGSRNKKKRKMSNLYKKNLGFRISSQVTGFHKKETSFKHEQDIDKIISNYLLGYKIQTNKCDSDYDLYCFDNKRMKYDSDYDLYCFDNKRMKCDSDYDLY